jgi:hypothetical protein
VLRNYKISWSPARPVNEMWKGTEALRKKKKKKRKKKRKRTSLENKPREESRTQNRNPKK